MNLVERAKAIILKPKEEWPVIAQEEPNVGQIMMGYVIPLALIPSVAAVIGYGFIGMPFFGSSFTWGIGTGITTFVASVLGVYLTAFVVDFLAPNFGSQKNFGRAMQLVAFAYTPAWVGGVLNLVPAIAWLGSLAGLYGIYLMYLGLPHTMKTPADKLVVYLVVVIIALIVIYIVLGAILGAIMATLGLGALSMLR
jgi:hypothetical protein